MAGFSEDAASLYLRPGDVIEAEIERIGVLRNPVVGGRRRTASRAGARALVNAFREAFPIVNVDDIDEAIAFYSDTFGFRGDLPVR